MGRFLQRYGVLVALLGLFAAVAARQPDVFLQPENLRNLLNQNAAVGVIAVGMTLVIAGGGIDLSVGSMMALAAALGITALNRSIAGGTGEAAAAVAGCVVCIVAGLVMGALNGFIVAYGRVAPFIGTLIGLVAYRSLTLALAEGGEVRSSATDAFPALGTGGIPVPFIQVAGGQSLVATWGILALLLSALIGSIILAKTRFGRNILAIGGNERAAHYASVRTASTSFWTYTLLGAFTGLSALLMATRMNSVASGSLGEFYELDAIAAVVIGGTPLNGGHGRVWGTLAGVVLLSIITNMLIVEGVAVYWQGVVKGAIILAAVLLQRGASAP